MGMGQQIGEPDAAKGYLTETLEHMVDTGHP